MKREVAAVLKAGNFRGVCPINRAKSEGKTYNGVLLPDFTCRNAM